MTSDGALIATRSAAFAENYLIDTAAIVFDDPPHPLFLCAVLASPFLLCALPLTWLLTH